MNTYYNASKAATEIACLVPSSVFDPKLVVTLDSEFYDPEPDDLECVDVEERLQQAYPVICTPAEFCEHVANGGSWTSEVREPSEHGWGKLVGQQLFSLEFNLIDGCAPQCSEKGFLAPEDAYARAVGLGLVPLCVYHTLPSLLPMYPAFRLVFALKTMVDKPTALLFTELLFAVFPEARRPGPYADKFVPGVNCNVLGPWFSWEGTGDEQ